MPGSEASSAPASTSVLIVDDNPLNLKLVRVLLRSEGFEVRTASDAEEALEVLEGFQPRVILMDIQLPGMDGLAFTRRLKADPATRDIAIIALTAYAMKGDEEKALGAGCDAYMSKPIDTHALPALVARHAAASAAAGRATRERSTCPGS
jgi:CheY-like chemotaxis protein